MDFKNSKKIVPYFLPFLLLVAGIYLFPLKFLETDFSKIPGDLGDARFNNYILEHGHKYLTGKVEKYWDAPFMYPFKNVIAFSDNLLGTVPIYSVFRLSGADRETAFQFWFLAMFALNFICCFWALNKWSGNIILSSAGAYIFAFSIFNLGQINHAQVFPRFIIPLIFYWSWKFLSGKELKYLLFTSLGIVYQFYCGIYLGFLLLYVLMFFFIAWFIVYRDWQFFARVRRLKTLGYSLLIIITSMVLLIPLMMPYINISQITGMRNFEEIIDTVPRLQSYFFSSPASLLWNFLYERGADSFPSWWYHSLFPGALPWLGIFAIPFVFISGKIGAAEKKFIAFISLGFFLSFIFCLNLKEFTLYRIIFELPGFSSMRSIDRIINVEIIYFILIFVFVFKEFSLRNKIWKVIAASFSLLIIVDNLINPLSESGRFAKLDSQRKIWEIEENIKQQYDGQHMAFAFMPVNMYGETNEAINGKLIETHLNVMLAAQELNIPCVNAYSGYSPKNFPQFFHYTDDESLRFWCMYNDSIFNKIQTINDINKKEKFRMPIHLKAGNGKFICADASMNNILIANREIPESWETFLLIQFENNECVLRAHNNRFIYKEPDEKAGVSAFINKISEKEILSIIETDSNHVAFKSSDNKYLSLNENSLKLSFNADSIGMNEQFTIIKEYNIDKKEKSRAVVHLKANNDKFISADESSNNILVANREKTGSWETFLLIRFENNECALRSNNHQFFSVDLNQKNAISAISKSIGRRETFTIVEIGGDYIAFKAFNGKFLTLDNMPRGEQIFANSDSIGNQEKFMIKIE